MRRGTTSPMSRTPGNRVTYTLNDANGQVSKVTSPSPTGVSASTVETTYTYNDRNSYLLDSVTRGNVSNYYGYDSVNRLTSIYHNGFITTLPTTSGGTV